MTRRTITEAEAERMADRRVWQRLATDPSYRHAEDAEAQAEAEARVAAEVWREIEAEHDVS